MAGQNIPSFSISASTTTTAVMGVVPAGKMESICLMASIPFGTTTDGLLNVYLIDPASVTAFLLYQEPIRYRQPGGSPVLLQNFIVPAGAYVAVQDAVGTSNMHVNCYNRWRFDAVAGQNMPTFAANLASGGGAALVGPIPAGKMESLCLSVALNGAAADGYVNAVLIDPVNAPGGIGLVFEEPVRFRQPGGSPVLLLDFTLSPGCTLSANAIGQALQLTVFNRWRFDA